MKPKGLTLSIIFEAESANYGEGVGNITSLKKMSRDDGSLYSYISRQAIRYNIIQQMECDNTPVNDDSGVVQFAPIATITDYPEIDLFGYMKTKSKSEGSSETRNAVVRLSNAISLEPFNSELDFLNNMGLAKRNNVNNAIAQSEIHRSFYSYTITIDLDRIGIDKDIEIAKQEKVNRIEKLLDTIQFLYRDIKGRRENLAPIFVIGGVYNRKSPFFENRIHIKKGALEIEPLTATINNCDETKSNTITGMVNGIFKNSDDISKELNTQSISDVFNQLKNRVREYYEKGC